MKRDELSKALKALWVLSCPEQAAEGHTKIVEAFDTLKMERDLLREGSAEWQEECNSLRRERDKARSALLDAAKDVITLEERNDKLREAADMWKGRFEGWRTKANSEEAYATRLRERLARVDEFLNQSEMAKCVRFIEMKSRLALADALLPILDKILEEKDSGSDVDYHLKEELVELERALDAYREGGNEEEPKCHVGRTLDMRDRGNCPYSGRFAHGGVVKGPEETRFFGERIEVPITFARGEWPICCNETMLNTNAPLMTEFTCGRCGEKKTIPNKSDGE